MTHRGRSQSGRFRTWAAGAALLSLIAAACGGGGTDEGAAGGTDAAGTDAAGTDAPGTDAAGTEAAGDVAAGEITVWIMQPGNEEVETVLTDAAEAFEAEHEGATVALEFVPWANAHDQFVTAIGGGQVPDLAEMGNTWTPEFAELGGLATVDSEQSGDYIDSLVESGTVDGALYGYPWYAGARSLIYRSDIFDELGLEAPQTWDDLLAVGDAIAEETDLAPIHVAGDYYHMLAPMVWQAGGELATGEGDSWTAEVDSEAGVQAFALYNELWERGWSPDGAVTWNSVDVRDAFANGDAAMMVGGGWDLAAILGTNPDLEGSVATTLLPEGPGGNRDTFAGGSHLVVFEESEAKELAGEFAEFLLEPEQITAFTEQIGFLPGTVSGVEASSASGDELYETFATQLVEHSRSYPPTAAWGAIEGDRVLPDTTQLMMQGELDPEEAAAEVDARMDEAFSG
jgi:N,N'-diacetylchitobiose transport system substrate-binding protein